MPVFTWEGRTRQGTTKKGVIEAPSEAAVMTQLRGQMIVPVKVKPKAKDLLEGFDVGCIQWAPGALRFDEVVDPDQGDVHSLDGDG